MQRDLFSAASLAPTVVVPPAPELVPHYSWPFPGMTPRESAQAALARSSGYADMLAAVIKSQGSNQLSSAGVKALIPGDWRKLMGDHLHASMAAWQCKQRGIELDYLPCPAGGGVFMYRAMGDSHGLPT